MMTENLQKLEIEFVDWGAFAPSYPYRFNGPGYLYCVGCSHFIRRVWLSSREAMCADCDRVLGMSTYNA